MAHGASKETLKAVRIYLLSGQHIVMHFETSKERETKITKLKHKSKVFVVYHIVYVVF